jgi:type I restriction enzyme M protein
MQDRSETYDTETNPNGRWRRFSEDDIKAREDLNFKWIDFTEEDDRSVGEILDEMQEEADGISAAVEQLKELLGGIEL